MAQEHYFPWRPASGGSGERDGGRAVSQRSLICVRFWMSVSRLFETGCLSVLT